MPVTVTWISSFSPLRVRATTHLEHMSKTKRHRRYRGGSRRRVSGSDGENLKELNGETGHAGAVQRDVVRDEIQLRLLGADDRDPAHGKAGREINAVAEDVEDFGLGVDGGWFGYHGEDGCG